MFLFVSALLQFRSVDQEGDALAFFEQRPQRGKRIWMIDFLQNRLASHVGQYNFALRFARGAFDQAVNALDEKLGSLMTFKYVGTLPPYNFVNLVINTKGI